MFGHVEKRSIWVFGQGDSSRDIYNGRNRPAETIGLSLVNQHWPLSKGNRFIEQVAWPRCARARASKNQRQATLVAPAVQFGPWINTESCRMCSISFEYLFTCLTIVHLQPWSL